MRKGIALLLAAVFCLSLAGCSSGRVFEEEETIRQSHTESWDIVRKEEKPEKPRQTESAGSAYDIETAEKVPSRQTQPQTLHSGVSEAEKQTGESPREDTDHYRPAYYLGNCREMSGEVYVLTFFVDDDESSWNDEKVTGFINQCLTPGFTYLQQKAAEWNVTLNFVPYHFSTDDEYEIRYPGVFSGELSAAGDQYDVLDVMGECLGLGDSYDLDEYFKDFFDTDQVAYNVVLNKPGHCYTMPDKMDDGTDLKEYCTYFTSYQNGTPLGAFTVAHETMHLFGAEDYYDPYGTYPNRKALVEQIFPNELMLRWDADVYNLMVSHVTAYSVGWTDAIPETVTEDDWWS